MTRSGGAKRSSRTVRLIKLIITASAIFITSIASLGLTSGTAGAAAKPLASGDIAHEFMSAAQSLWQPAIQPQNQPDAAAPCAAASAAH